MMVIVIGSGISPEEILGCTQVWADNYSEQATEEDNTCFRVDAPIIYSLIMIH